MKAIIGQWKADMIQTSRDKRYLILLLAMPVILYLVYTSKLSTQSGKGLAESAGFMVAMIAFGVMASSVNTLSVRLAAERQSGWTSFLRTSPMSAVTYSIAKALTQWTFTLATIVILFFVAHFYKGVDLPLNTWISLGAWLWAASLPFAVLGILIGMTGSSAQVLGTLTFLALALLGGLMGGLSGVFGKIDSWLPTHYYVQPGLDLLQNKGPNLTDIVVLGGYTILFIMASAFLHKGGTGGLKIKNKRWTFRLILICLAILWFLYHHQMI